MFDVQVPISIPIILTLNQKRLCARVNIQPNAVSWKAICMKSPQRCSRTSLCGESLRPAQSGLLIRMAYLSEEETI